MTKLEVLKAGIFTKVFRFTEISDLLYMGHGLIMSKRNLHIILQGLS